MHIEIFSVFNLSQLTKIIMKITVAGKQVKEGITAANHLEIESRDKKLFDEVNNFPTSLIGFENAYQDRLDEVEIELRYNAKNEIVWGFKNNVSDEIKEAILKWRKDKKRIAFRPE
jgi:uncharacterized protein YihD (DUF1040 family)